LEFVYIAIKNFRVSAPDKNVMPNGKGMEPTEELDLDVAIPLLDVTEPVAEPMAEPMAEPTDDAEPMDEPMDEKPITPVLIVDMHGMVQGGVPFNQHLEEGVIKSVPRTASAMSKYVTFLKDEGIPVVTIAEMPYIAKDIADMHTVLMLGPPGKEIPTAYNTLVNAINNTRRSVRHADLDRAKRKVEAFDSILSPTLDAWDTFVSQRGLTELSWTNDVMGKTLMGDFDDDLLQELERKTTRQTVAPVCRVFDAFLERPAPSAPLLTEPNPPPKRQRTHHMTTAMQERFVTSERFRTCTREALRPM
jgi:hypothetical protein